MTWEALTALGTLISAAIVAVAAGAAILQIRHLRAGNQLEAILRIYDKFNSDEMLAARAYCLNELPAVLADRISRRANLTSEIDPRTTSVGNFFNELGALVVDGFLAEKLVWPLVPSAARLWRVISPVAQELRRERPDPVWADFEYVAALEERITRETHVARFPAWFRPRLTAEPRTATVLTSSSEPSSSSEL